jgi:hypothetical protein
MIPQRSICWKDERGPAVHPNRLWRWAYGMQANEKRVLRSKHHAFNEVKEYRGRAVDSDVSIGA